MRGACTGGVLHGSRSGPDDDAGAAPPAYSGFVLSGSLTKKGSRNLFYRISQTLETTTLIEKRFLTPFFGQGRPPTKVAAPWAYLLPPFFIQTLPQRVLHQPQGPPGCRLGKRLAVLSGRTVRLSALASGRPRAPRAARLSGPPATAASGRRRTGPSACAGPVRAPPGLPYRARGSR